MSRTISALAQALAEHVLGEATELNHLDAVAGDGDLGVTMSTAAEAIVAIAPGLDDKPPDAALRELGMTVARRAPSTAGTLLATALLAMAGVPPVEDEQIVAATARRLSAALDAIEARGGAHVGDKTLLDALAPATVALDDAARAGLSMSAALGAATSAAQEGAERTRDMRARVGRAGWLADRSEGSPDAGAVLVAMMFEAARDAWKAERGGDRS